MIPLQVTSIGDAVRAGSDNFGGRQNRFIQGVQDLGKGLSQGILTARLVKEDEDALKAQRLQAAIDAGDMKAMNELTQPGMFGRLFGKKEEVLPGVFGRPFSADEYGGSPEMQAFAKTINEENIRKRADAELAELNSRPTAKRAAERAGMATGYIPESEQDKMNFDADQKMKELDMDSVIKNKDKLLQVASQFNTRANGIRASIGGMMAKPELTTEDKEFIKQQKADLKSQLNAYEKIRKKAISEGVDPDFFAEFSELESGNDSFVPTDKLEEFFVSTLQNPESNFKEQKLGLPIIKAKVKAAFPDYDFNMLTDGDWKKIQGYQHEMIDLARGNTIEENQVKQSKQDVVKGGQAIKNADFTFKQNKFNSEFPNYSSWQNTSIQNKATNAKAATLFEKGNYKGVIETLKASIPESSRIGLKLPIFSLSFSDNPSESDALTAIESFIDSINVIEGELKRANARKKELGL